MSWETHKHFQHTDGFRKQQSGLILGDKVIKMYTLLLSLLRIMDTV